MNIAKLLKQINAYEGDRIPLDLLCFDFQAMETRLLIGTLNDNNFQQAELHWRDFLSADKICDYFLNILAQTAIRDVVFYIPIPFGQAEMRAVLDGIKKVQEKVQEQEINPPFKINLRETPVEGELAKRVFSSLLFKLKRGMLDTKTITIPTQCIYLNDNYDESAFTADLQCLLASGKFTKLVFEWNENANPIIDEQLNGFLDAVVDMALNSTIKHFEIDMTKGDFCEEHHKFADYIARYAEIKFAQLTDQKRCFTVNKVAPAQNVHELFFFAAEMKAEKSRLRKISSGTREKENKSPLGEKIFTPMDSLIVTQLKRNS